MVQDITKALVQNKHLIVIAVAIMVVCAYVIPFGIMAEAKPTFPKDNYGKAYGHVKFGFPPHTGGVGNGH